MSGNILAGLALRTLVLVVFLLSACAPAAAPTPTAVLPKPAAPAAPAKPAPTSPPAKPAATAVPAKAAPTTPAKAPTAPPAAKPATKLTFDEQAVADFYRGKTIRMIVGLEAGGGTDAAARVLIRHMPRHIPGNPNIVVENKPGASGFVAANLVYNVEPKDGTVILAGVEGNPLQQALDTPGMEFDVTKFQWLGSLVDDRGSCVARVATGVSTIQDTLNGTKLIVGAGTPGGTTFDIPTVLKHALGANFEIVPGYPGSAEIILAIQRQEADVLCLSFGSLLTRRQILEGDKPIAKFIVILGSEVPDHPALKGVPAAETLAKTEEAQQMLRAVAAAGKITNPHAVAPGVPADRVAALRRAYELTIADPQYKAEMERVKPGAVARNWESITQVIQEVMNTPPATLAKLKAILK